MFLVRKKEKAPKGSYKCGLNFPSEQTSLGRADSVISQKLLLDALPTNSDTAAAQCERGVVAVDFFFRILPEFTDIFKLSEN